MKIFIADHSDLVRDRVKALIQELPNVEIVGETPDFDRIFDMASTLNPGLVVMNFHKSDGSGLGLLTQLKKLSPPPLVLVMTNYSEQEYMRACLKAGADYFLDKTYGLEKMVDIVKEHL